MRFFVLWLVWFISIFVIFLVFFLSTSDRRVSGKPGRTLALHIDVSSDATALCQVET